MVFRDFGGGDYRRLLSLHRGEMFLVTQDAAHMKGSSAEHSHCTCSMCR